MHTQVEGKVNLLGHDGLGTQAHVLELAVAIDKAALESIRWWMKVPES